MKLIASLKSTTIRRRLTLIFAASAILILLFAGYFIYSFSARFRKNEFKLRLENRLEEVQEIMRRNPAGSLPPFSKYDDAVLPREQLQMYRPGEVAWLTSPEGSVQLPPPNQLRSSRAVIHLRQGRRDFALLYDHTLNRLLVVSAIDVYGYTKMNNLRKVILVCLACSVVLLGFVSWYWTRRMLAPIAAKIQRAQLIGTTSLNLRLEVKNPADELGMLAQTFNEMLDRLEQGFKAQQQFIGNASHELRTPLTILRSEAEWALSKARTNDEYRQVIEKVQQKSNYLSNLINRLLILARINGPATAKDLQLVRLDEILLHTAEQLKQETADAQPVQITIDTAATAEYTLRGDASMLHTAVANLLENALKYGLGHKVEVTLTQPLPWHQIAILDYGIGISPEESALVFDPFYRSKTARSMAAGTGLGLTLVKAIAQWHGGSIELAPHPYGTLFVLKLPCPTDQVWSRL